MGLATPVAIPPATGTAVAVRANVPLRAGFQLHVTVNGADVGVALLMHPGIRTLANLKVILEAYSTVAVIVMADW